LLRPEPGTGFQAALSELYKIYIIRLCACAAAVTPEDTRDLTKGFSRARAQDAGTRGLKSNSGVLQVIAKLSPTRQSAHCLNEAEEWVISLDYKCREPIQIELIDTPYRKGIAARWKRGCSAGNEAPQGIAPQRRRRPRCSKVLDVDNIAPPRKKKRLCRSVWGGKDVDDIVGGGTRHWCARRLSDGSDPADVDEIHELCEALVVAEG
jgi:hypothetical protein